MSIGGNGLVGDIVKAHRLSKGISKDLISNNLGMTVNTYSLKENNKAAFTLREFEVLVTILGIDPVCIIT